MHRVFFFIAIFFLLFPVHAQTNERHACTTDLAALENAVGRDLSGDCATYSSCKEAGDAYCYLRVIIANLENCQAGDNRCITGAKLLGLSFELYEHPYIDQDTFYNEIYSSIPRALAAFISEDLQSAIELYQTIYDSGYYHPAAYTGIAIIEAYSGRNEAALEHYLESMKQYYLEAPLYWLRAETLLAMGMPERAMLDAFLFTQLIKDDSAFRTFAADFDALIPLDESRFTNWMYYPIDITHISPGGDLLTDRSYLSAIPIRMLHFEDSVLLEAMDGWGISSWLVLLKDVSITGSEVYSARYGDNYYAGLTMEMLLSLRGNNEWALEINVYGFEGGSQQHGVLLQLGTADPRPSIDDFRCTENSPRSQGFAGETVYPARFGVLVYESPVSENIISDISAEFIRTNEFRLLAGPICVGNVLWFWGEVVETGEKVWTWEAAPDTYYTFLPLEDNETRGSLCNAALRPRFTIGVRGIVVPDLGANRLRAEPGSSAEIVGEMPPNAEFTVVDGFVCADGLTWWQVDYQGMVAWTAEGENGVYWLEPSQQQE